MNNRGLVKILIRLVILFLIISGFVVFLSVKEKIEGVWEKINLVVDKEEIAPSDEVIEVSEDPKIKNPENLNLENNKNYKSEDLVFDMKLTSPVFNSGEIIPSKYTCEGENISPPLNVVGVPENAESLVLIMWDPDVPLEIRKDGNWDHWVVFNMPADTKEILEGVGIGVSGVNTGGTNSYIGPCPPKEYEPKQHRYFFKLYALDINLTLGIGATKEEIEKASLGHVLEQSELLGVYEKK